MNKNFLYTMLGISSVLLCAALAYYFVIFSKKPMNHDKSYLENNAEITNKDKSILNEGNTTDRSADDTISQLSLEEAFYKEKPAYKRYLDVLNWRTEKFGTGYILPNELASYDYDITILEQLAYQGDFKAMHVLAHKYFMLSDLKNAERLYKQAAIHGSTHALYSLARIHFPFDSEPEERRKSVIARLPYYHVALRRGDQSFHDKIRHELAADSNIGFDAINLTNDEIARIEYYTNMMYEGLEKSRTEYGLPEFDNSIPEFVQDFYRQLAIDSYSDYTDGDSSFFIQEESSDTD